MRTSHHQNTSREDVFFLQRINVFEDIWHLLQSLVVHAGIRELDTVGAESKPPNNPLQSLQISISFF